MIKKNIYDRIEEATGGVVYLGAGLPYPTQDDGELDWGYVHTLVEYGYLDYELKREILEVFLTDEDYDDPEELSDPDRHIFDLLLKFAAMDPQVDVSGFLQRPLP